MINFGFILASKRIFGGLREIVQILPIMRPFDLQVAYLVLLVEVC